MAELPEYIEACPRCGGKGEYEQTYNAGCGGGYYTSTGACSQCATPGHYRGVGYVYKATGMPAPRSVVEQIKRGEP